MGESLNDPFRVDFDREAKLEFHRSTITSAAISGVLNDTHPCCR
jgi:hypothetical protein